MDERTKKLIETYNSQGSITPGQIGDVFASTSINSSLLSTKDKPLTLPQVDQPNTAAGISGLTSAVKDAGIAQAQLQREQEQKQMEAEAKAGDTRNRMEKLLGGIKGVFSSKETEQEAAGIPEKAQKVTDYTNQLEALDRAETNEIRALETANMTDTGRASSVRDIQRKYAFQKADVALLQSAANRDLLTAQTIVDSKIQMALEPLQLEYDFVSKFYEENKADLTKEEDRMFNLKVKETEKAYEEAKTLQETIGKLQFQAASQGAAPSVVQAIGRATTTGDAIQAAGVYAGDVLERQIKQAQLAKLLEEVNTTSTGGKLTAAQQTALSYAQRVNDSNAIINEVGSQFTGVGSYFGQYAPNALKSADRQKFEQAQRNFINAVLRRESGAAIAESEFDSARQQYFPQPGDSIAVSEQKRLNRERTLENLLREGGQDISVVNESKDPLGIGIGANPLGI